jgi:hypothetical protein
MNLELINVILQNLELEQGAVVAIVYLEQVHDYTRKLLYSRRSTVSGGSTKSWTVPGSEL